MAYKLQDHLQLLTEAYARSKGSAESEEDLLVFENKYGCRLPSSYRWLLLHFGACHFLDPWIYSLRELEWAYPDFLAQYKEYEREYKLAPRYVFPIGGMGDGSIVIEDVETGEVLVLLHDCAEDDPFEQIADSFDQLILEQIHIVNSFEL